MRHCITVAFTIAAAMGGALVGTAAGAEPDTERLCNLMPSTVDRLIRELNRTTGFDAEEVRQRYLEFQRRQCRDADGATAAQSIPYLPQASPVPRVDGPFQDCPECPVMRLVPEGRTIVGAMRSNNQRDGDEAMRVAEVIAPFAMGETEVTRGAFAAFIRATGYKPGSDCWLWNGIDQPRARRQRRSNSGWRKPGFAQQDDEPVVCVSWDDANAYSRWLSTRTGARYRLPTELEWEYAARAGRQTAFWWGDNIGQGTANYQFAARSGSTPGIGRRTTPAHAFQPNPWGLYGVHGNAWEWTVDCYDDDDGISAVVSVRRERQRPCRQRTARGGSWGNRAEDLRASNRLEVPPRYRSNLIGFRVLKDLATK